MPNKTWKQAERRAAALFGTVRNPLSGSASRQTAADTLHPELYIEVKHRKHHPNVSLYYEVAEQACKEKKVPVLVLVEKRRQNLFAVVPLDFDYLIRLAMALKEGKARGETGNQHPA